MDKAIKEFQVSIYGNLKPYNQTISKARCRIFYKGLNRNGSFISEEFANKLISSLPYTPVKGIYDDIDEDFTDHGQERTQGRIYGVVPENPNFAWESHLDDDGITREYACTDVLVYTALYEEVRAVIEKPQSMELYEPSIQGTWTTIDGQRAFEFTDGCFLGLQILGDNTEPCFEGAQFFTLMETLEKIKKYGLVPEQGGSPKMDIKFNLGENVDSTLTASSFSHMNSNFNEEGLYTVDTVPVFMNDGLYGYNYSTSSFGTYSYEQAEDGTYSFTSGENVNVFVTSGEEVEALNTLKEIGEGTYAKAVEIYNATTSANTEYAASIEEMTAKNSEFEQKIEELNVSISTLETEKGEFVAKVEEANGLIAQLNEKVAALEEYKLNIENGEKDSVIDSYSEILSDEVLNSYKENKANYTMETLDMHLAYEAKKANAEVFTKLKDNQQRVPTPQPRSEMDAYLAKYVK